MRVLIVGGGIGGLALAGGLAGSGSAGEVEVLESGAALRTSGAALTLYSNGLAALAQLGAPLPERLGGRIDLLRIHDERGRRLIGFDLTVMRRRTGFPVITLPRRALLQHLADRLPEGLATFGTAVTEVRPGDRPAVVSAAGTHEADVLVGADGHRSLVRSTVLGGTPARPTGWATWQGVTEVLPQLAAGHTGQLFVGDSGLVGLMPAGNGLLQWWFDVQRDLPAERPRQALQSLFAGYPGPVQELLGQISDADIEHFPHVLHQVPDVWGAGPVTLLGDSAHAFPPSQAQGANQALEDAWLLRDALLGAHGDLVERLRRYERLRAPRVRRVSRMAGAETTNKPPHPLLRQLTARIPAPLVGAAHTRLMRRFSNVLHGERL